jgi:uncharacterized Zn finger protein
MNGTASTDFDVFQQMKNFDTSKPVVLKAHRYLTDGKVKVVSVRPDSAVVLVYGTDTYNVVRKQTWICDCPSRQPICAHVVAASLVCDLDTFEVPQAEKVTPFNPGAFMGKAS